MVRFIYARTSLTILRFSCKYVEYVQYLRPNGPWGVHGKFRRSGGGGFLIASRVGGFFIEYGVSSTNGVVCMLRVCGLFEIDGGT